MDYTKLSIKDYVDGVKAGKIDIVRAVKTFVDRAKADKKNAVLEIFDSWEEQAKRMQEIVRTDTKSPPKTGRPITVQTSGLPLVGVPVIIKDNLWYKGHRSSAASRILEGFVAPQTATAVQKLVDAGAIIIGRANMDEFGMGGTGRNSGWGVTKNAHSDKHVAGGSSSGSAVSVALDYCMAALGTDTGGSMRCPAAFNGVVGLKPTYGSVSRYGVMAYANSLEQIGVFARTVADAQLVLSQIMGHDPLDITTRQPDPRPQSSNTLLRIGKVKEIWQAFKESPYLGRYEAVLAKFKEKGATVVDVSVPSLSVALATYYIISCTEAASNLSRFDGVRFTPVPGEPETITDLYLDTRSKLFGKEVKNRILLGNFLACTGHEASQFYKKAKQAQAHIAYEIEKAFEKCDCMIMPSMAGEATLLEDNNADPIAEYLADLFTVPANLSGVPAISVPFGVGQSGLPLGLQILVNKNNEQLMFDLADEVKL